MNQLNSKSLTELQRLVETNNDDITLKKQDIETKRKKVREMRVEQARQQAALAQQNHVSMNNHDQRIYQLKEQLARQQDQIRQIRSNPNITENVSEQLEILRSRLADKQTLLHDATKFYEQLTVTLTKNENSVSRHSDRTPIPDALLRPHMTNLNEYLTQEARRVSKAQEILLKRRSSTEKLDAQINEMKAALAHQKQNTGGNVQNSATVVPWIQKNNNTLPNSISKRVDIPHGSSSTGSENSGNVRAGSPGNRINLPSYGQIQNQRNQNQNQNSQIQNLQNQHQNPQSSKIMNTPIGVKSASDGIVNQNYKLTPQLIQDHYLEQLRGKHYPTPLKKRSSISESLEGLNRHTNTRAGYLFNRQYKSPDTFHPESKKDPPPYPGISPTRQGSGPGTEGTRGQHRNLAVGGFLTQIDSENDSSNSSPNNSLNKDQQEKAKLVSDKAKFDADKARNLEKIRTEKMNEVSKFDENNLPQIDETSYAASDLRKRFEKTIENSKSEHVLPVASGDNSNISPSNQKAPPPATPPRTSSTAFIQNSQNSQNSPIHPVDSAIKNSQHVKNPNPQSSPGNNTRNRSPSPPPKSPPKVGVVLPVQKEPVPVKSAPKVLRPERSSHKTEDPREHKCNHNKRIIFDPFAILLDASLEGEFDLVKQIMKSVPDPSKSNDEGITALHNAVCAGHMKIVELRIVVKLYCVPHFRSN